MNSDKIIFSIVVPTHNRRILLQQCLDALIRQHYESGRYEIIVVDDASDDDTNQYMAGIKNDKMKYVRFEGRKGHAYCRNEGFLMANGEYIASIDDDCIPPVDWLERIEKYFLINTDCAAIGGSINRPDTSNKYAIAEYILNSSSWFPSAKRGYVRNIPTCNIAYRKECIKSIRFDHDSIEVAYRDSLFNLSLLQSGYKILFIPEISVRHDGFSESMDQFLKTQQKYGAGFVRDGYLCHGLAGKIFMKVPGLLFSHVRLFLVTFRCMKDLSTFMDYIRSFSLILHGENERIKTIIRKIKDVKQDPAA